jgi:hypothetical protein
MKIITLVERAAQIRRRLASGVRMPPAEELQNSGRRRTADKRALLSLLEETARAQGREPPFKARY